MRAVLRSQEVGEEGDHCHHQNDFCIQMDSDESRFNVSLIVGDKVRKTVFINRNF